MGAFLWVFGMALAVEVFRGKPLENTEKTTTGHKPAKPSKKSKRSKKKRKSHPRTTKACRCDDRHHCHYPWINADTGAGTVVKSTGKMYWAHKASTLGLPGQEVLLDAVAMNDAASHDSQSLLPHLNRLFQRHPDLKGIVTRVLDDGAADDAKLKAAIRKDLAIEVLAPINPRRRSPIRDGMPRGIDHLTPRGVPVCHAGYAREGSFSLPGTPAGHHRRRIEVDRLHDKIRLKSGSHGWYRGPNFALRMTSSLLCRQFLNTTQFGEHEFGHQDDC